jgi:hypothetical protein
MLATSLGWPILWTGMPATMARPGSDARSSSIFVSLDHVLQRILHKRLHPLVPDKAWGLAWYVPSLWRGNHARVVDQGWQDLGIQRLGLL